MSRDKPTKPIMLLATIPMNVPECPHCKQDHGIVNLKPIPKEQRTDGGPSHAWTCPITTKRIEARLTPEE